MSENILVVRFRAYTPNGASLGILPHPLSWEAGLPFDDMSSLTMTYPDGSEAADLLKTPCEVGLELRNPRTGEFKEYPGCRFINIKRSENLAARPRVLSFTMPSYGWQLRKVRFMSRDNPRLNKENRIVYKTAVGPGQILKDILDESKGRQNIPGLTYDFNGAQDSSGAAWVLKVSGEFDLGQDAWSIVDSFAKQGLLDWWFNEREFEVFKPNTVLRRQLDTDTGVNIHARPTASEEPVERTWEENAGHLLVIGDTRSTRLVEADASADLPWGKWDEAFSASGITDKTFMLDIGEHMLETKYKARSQFTKRLVWTEGAPVPLIDYRQGDFVRAQDDTGSQKAAMRVYQITLSGVDPYGVSIALTLNDRFTDRALQTERWVARVTGSGGPVGGGGTGAGASKPPPPAQDSTPPKTPQNPQVANSPYFSELGDPVAMADVSFEVVLEDILDNEIDVVHYNVAAQRSDHNFQQARVAQVPQPSSPSTGQRVHGLVPLLDSGYTYYFYVQAVRASGYTSEWSEVVSQEMGYPTEVPPAPSRPLLSSKLSTVKAEWDGEDESGLGYPPSLREIQVEVSSDNSTWYHVDEIFSPGSSVIMSGKGGVPTWGVGDTVYVRFRARNSASVISAPSEVASIVVVGVEGPDIEANSITANNIAAGTLTAEQIKAHSLSVDRLAVGDPKNLIIDPAFTSEDLNQHRIDVAQASTAALNVWSIDSGVVTLQNNYVDTNNYNRFGFVNNTLVSYPLHEFPGPELTTPELAIPVTRPAAADGVSGNIRGRCTVAVSGMPATPDGSRVSVGLLMRQFDRAGASLPYASVIVDYFDIPGNGTYTLQSTGGTPIDEGVVGVIPYIYVILENGVDAGVSLSFSGLEIWQEGSVFIGQGMVKAPLIEANAITTDKLAADAITAKHSIRSAYYEMNSQTSGGATVKITENANHVGQSGIRWDGLIPSGGSGPRIFQSDVSATGGWDARGFVICGPEQVTNDSGRIDLQFAYGVTNSHIKRSYGTETISVQGLFWDTSIARFRIGGMFNTGHYTNDMLRFDRSVAQNGTYSYGSVTTRRYYPIITPNGGSSPVTSSILDFPDGTENGFRYVSSSGTNEIFFLVACGTP